MLHRLTLFDLDYTLLPFDSDYEWGEYLVQHGLVDAGTYRERNQEFFVQYKAGTLDIAEFLAFALAPLARHPREMLDQIHGEFMRDVIVPGISARARELIKAHQDAHDLCAIVTATNAFVTGPIARELGVAHLVATVPAQQDGVFTGAVRGTPCYRQGKITRVIGWLESLGLSMRSFAQTTFYSDSANDLPLLEAVSTPVATNPDETLRAVAQSRGWRILELHNDQATHP
jgi:HAD superfamily hydrolase (TIGR01490 family)